MNRQRFATREGVRRFWWLIPSTAIAVGIWLLPRVGVWGPEEYVFDYPPGVEFLLIGIVFAAFVALLLTSGQGIVLNEDTLTQINSWPSYGLSVPYSSIRRVEVDEVAGAVNVVYEGEFVEREWSDELRPTRLKEFLDELRKRVEAATGKTLEIVNRPKGGLGFRRMSG